MVEGVEVVVTEVLLVSVGVEDAQGELLGLPKGLGDTDRLPDSEALGEREGEVDGQVLGEREEEGVAG